MALPRNLQGQHGHIGSTVHCCAAVWVTYDWSVTRLECDTNVINNIYYKGQNKIKACQGENEQQLRYSSIHAQLLVSSHCTLKYYMEINYVLIDQTTEIGVDESPSAEQTHFILIYLICLT